MIFRESPLAGAWIIDLEHRRDERGSFARVFDAYEFRQRGLEHLMVQASISINARSGTLRGLHYQAAPHREGKLVRCTRGALYDVIVDLREGSPTYCAWYSAELTAGNGRMLYVPPGLAHGFQTLEDDTEIHYQMSHRHHPDSARGVRWDDEAFSIEWPAAERTISERDRSYPDHPRSASARAEPGQPYASFLTNASGQ